MYTYKISNNADSTSEKENVLGKLSEIDKKYSIEEYTPMERQSLGLEKKEYSGPSKDDVFQEAKESLKGEKASGLSSIEEKYSSKFSDLNEKAQSALEEKVDDILQAENDYKSSLRDTKNAGIKQGISRSSIYDEALKVVEQERDNEVGNINTEYQRAISKLESEKSILEQQKESALNSFDISYAVKLENKIANLNSAIAKEQESILKYNNQIAEKEANYQLQQEKAELAEKERIDKKNQDLLELVNKKGVTEVNRYKLQEKYEIVYDYLMSIPKSDALNELENDPRYERELSNYYATVYAKMLNRKE